MIRAAGFRFRALGVHGVLLYQQPGTETPPALARLTPFEPWVRRVERAMEEATSAPRE